MWIDFVELDIDTMRITDTRISDDVFQGARVPFDDLTKEDRMWLASLIERAAAAWLGRAPDGIVRFTAGALVNGGAAIDAKECARLLDMFLEAVAGTLLIDDGARGLTKRKGDAQA